MVLQPPLEGNNPSDSNATIPGVRYVYNVADTVLPGYNGAKMTIGFDNQASGTKSVLCNGDDASTITAQGFLPLTTGTTAPAGSDASGSTCREFQGLNFPSLGSPLSWTTPTFDGRSSVRKRCPSASGLGQSAQTTAPGRQPRFTSKVAQQPPTHEIEHERAMSTEEGLLSMPKRNARPGFPRPSDRSDRAVSTFFVSSRSKLLMNQSPQEESVIRRRRNGEQRAGETASAPRTARWRGWTVGVASLAAMLGTALVPGLGATPAGATGPHGDDHHRSLREHSSVPGRRGPQGFGPDQPHLRGLQPVQRRHGRGSDEVGFRLVYLIAGGSGSESNEYHIQTAPNPSPAFGSLTSGDAYLVAGTGTAGLIAAAGQQPVRQLDHGCGHGEPDHADLGGLRSQRQPPHRRREREVTRPFRSWPRPQAPSTASP